MDFGQLRCPGAVHCLSRQRNSSEVTFLRVTTGPIKEQPIGCGLELRGLYYQAPMLFIKANSHGALAPGKSAHGLWRHA